MYMKDFLNILYKNKVLMISVITIILVLGIVMGYSFSYFINQDVLENNNNVVTDCFKITYADANDIYLDKAYPISEEEGSNLTPYTFTIKNICKRTMNYEINLETLNTTTLSTEYLRYKLNDNDSAILGSQTQVSEYINSSSIDSRRLESSTLTADQEKTYNLRLWIDSNSTVDQTSNKTYKGKVSLKISTN